MGKVVEGVVDGNGLYFSRFAAAGPYVFMTNMAVDSSGEIPPEVMPDPPYHVSPAAHCAAQTDYVYRQYVDGLQRLGSSIDDVVQIEQFLASKKHADRHMENSRAPGFLERDRPASALMWSGPMVPSEAVLASAGIAIVPGEGFEKAVVPATPGYGDSLGRAEFGETYAEEPPFSEVITAGPYVFTVGDVAFDFGLRDVPEEVKAPSYIWWGSEIRNEAEFVLDRFQDYLERVGATLADVVHTTLFIRDIEDLYELDRVWAQRFPDVPPARSIIPVSGLGIPRATTGLSHQTGAVRFEHLSQSIRPGLGYRKEPVSSGADPLAWETEAVKAGPLLWVSQIYPGGKNGLVTSPDPESQVSYAFDRLEAICAAAGTGLADVLRLRAWVTSGDDVAAVFAELRRRVPSEPPAVTVLPVPGPLLVPGARVAIDAVAHVDE